GTYPCCAERSLPLVISLAPAEARKARSQARARRRCIQRLVSSLFFPFLALWRRCDVCLFPLKTRLIADIGRASGGGRFAHRLTPDKAQCQVVLQLAQNALTQPLDP